MKIHKILSIALMAVALPFMSACSDDEVVQTPLPTPVVSSTTTFNTISCSWDKIDGATSYGYELYDADGNLVQRDVTVTPSVSFTGLTYNTDYSVKVWAFGVYGSEDGTSDAVELQLTTADLTSLATPELTFRETSSTRVQFTWNAVANAVSYTYTLTCPDGTVQASASTGRTTVSFSLKQTGTYVFTIQADAAEDAEKDGYRSSDVVTYTFDHE